MNTDKKLDLLFWDCHSSVNIEYSTSTELYTIAVTEFEIDQENSTKHETNLKESSITEIYVSASEIDSLINALQYIRQQPKEVI